MRWIWIDKFVEFDSGKRAVAVKCSSLAEDHLHDLYPDFPIVPHSLIVEGMAQTAGMLVGEARGFAEKVILAKIGKATFHRLVRPGDSITFDATVEQLNETGASISGVVRLANADATIVQQNVQGSPPPGVGDGGALVATIDIMFSHIDNNLSGLEFPEHNFVFTSQFTDLLKNFRAGASLTL